MNVQVDVGLLFVVAKTLNRYNESDLVNRVIDVIERGQLEKSKRDSMNEYMDVTMYASREGIYLGPLCREIIRECREMTELFNLAVEQRVSDDGQSFPMFPKWVIRHVMDQRVQRPLAIIGGE